MDISSYYFIHAPLQESLKKAELEALLGHAVERKVSRGDLIFQEGDFPKGVYIIRKGRVKIFQRTVSGAEQVMNVHVSGEIIGYRPLLCNERYPVTGTALEAGVLQFVPRRAFFHALERYPAFSNLLLKYLSHEFTVWINTISVLARTTVKERLLLNLLILIMKYRDRSKWPVKITLSKADLASLTGTSNETLARILKVLKNEKLIASKGRSIEIAGRDQVRRIEKLVSMFV